MKPWLYVFVAVSVLCLFPAGNTLAAAGDLVGAESDKKRPMASPLAEMMFYEAAEQAVEDGYARIIPESENGTRQDAVDTGVEQAGQAPPSSGVEPDSREE